MEQKLKIFESEKNLSAVSDGETVCSCYLTGLSNEGL